MTEKQTWIDAVLAAHRTGSRFAPASAPQDRAAVLEIQAGVCAALGAVAGFKVGGPAGAPPVVAPILARYVEPNSGSRTVGDRLGVELEVGFELLRPLPAQGFPDRPEAFFQPCVALELVDTRLAGPLADAPLCKFADFQINAGMVIGDRLEGWNGTDFGPVEARLTAGEAVVTDGPAEVPGGSALANLRRLVAHLGGHCGGLHPGHVVLTGSLCGLPYFGPGTDIAGRIEGLGAVAFRIA